MRIIKEIFPLIIAGFLKSASVSVFDNITIPFVQVIAIYILFKSNVRWYIKALIYNVTFFLFSGWQLFSVLEEYQYSWMWGFLVMLILDFNIFFILFIKEKLFKKANIFLLASSFSLVEYFTIDTFILPISGNLALIPNFSTVGSYLGSVGFSFILYMIVLSLEKRQYKPFFASLMVIAFSYFYTEDNSNLYYKERITIFQANEDFKDSIDHHFNKTEEFEKRLGKIRKASKNGNLTVGPENYFRANFFNKENIPKNILIGGYGTGSNVAYFNEEFYYKNKLLYFGEYFPFLKEDILKGKELKVFSFKNIKFISPICFESAFPYLIDQAPENFDLILNPSNEYYVQVDNVRKAHTNIARWRSIENGVSTIKVNNGGESTIINPDGSFLYQTKSNKEIIKDFNVLVKKNKYQTFYSKFKFYPILIIFIISFFLFIKKRISI